MKHVKVMSSEKPAHAEETAWVDLANVFLKRPLTGTRANWVLGQINDGLTK